MRWCLPPVPPYLDHTPGEGGTPAYRRCASACDASVTVVSAVATATEPYNGQRRFQVSTSPSACSACTPLLRQEAKGTHEGTRRERARQCAMPRSCPATLHLMKCSASSHPLPGLLAPPDRCARTGLLLQ